MSGLPDIKAAMETRLLTLPSVLPTEWENDDFTPVGGVPYQQVHFLPAEPDNPTIGGSFRRERGIMQVTPAYPVGAGRGDADAMAQAIRDLFPRGTTCAANGVTVVIDRDPAILPGYNDGDRYRVPVRIRYYSNI